MLKVVKPVVLDESLSCTKSMKYHTHLHVHNNKGCAEESRQTVTAVSGLISTMYAWLLMYSLICHTLAHLAGWFVAYQAQVTSRPWVEFNITTQQQQARKPNWPTRQASARQSRHTAPQGISSQQSNSNVEAPILDYSQINTLEVRHEGSLPHTPKHLFLPLLSC